MKKTEKPYSWFWRCRQGPLRSLFHVFPPPAERRASPAEESASVPSRNRLSARARKNCGYNKRARGRPGQKGRGAQRAIPRTEKRGAAFCAPWGGTWSFFGKAAGAAVSACQKSVFSIGRCRRGLFSLTAPRRRPAASAAANSFGRSRLLTAQRRRFRPQRRSLRCEERSCRFLFTPCAHPFPRKRRFGPGLRAACSCFFLQK